MPQCARAALPGVPTMHTGCRRPGWSSYSPTPTCPLRLEHPRPMRTLSCRLELHCCCAGCRRARAGRAAAGRAAACCRAAPCRPHCCCVQPASIASLGQSLRAGTNDGGWAGPSRPPPPLTQRRLHCAAAAGPMPELAAARRRSVCSASGGAAAATLPPPPRNATRHACGTALLPRLSCWPLSLHMWSG